MAENQPPSSTSHTTPHPPLPPSFRPTFPTRSSYNYAQAEAQARSEKGVHASSDAFTLRKASVGYGDDDERSRERGGEGKEGQGKGVEEEEGKGEGRRVVGQSEQDMKRAMQERLMVGEGGRGRGFSEK